MTPTPTTDLDHDSGEDTPAPCRPAPEPSGDRMSSLTPADVARLAALARIDLSDAELGVLAPQLDQILDSVARVQQAGADEVPGTSHPLPLTNVVRPDVVVPPLGAEAALAGAPAVQDGRFRVPQILADDQ